MERGNPWKIIFKALSNPNYSIKENYEFHRNVITASSPYFKPLYNMVDKKIITPEREVPVRIFRPKKNNLIGNNNKETNRENNKVKKPSDIIIFFHGGGWVTGSVDSYTSICGNMSKETDCIVISVDYRLAPEYPFPAGLEDCYNVTKVIADNINKEASKPGKNRKPRKLILSGDSAGGNLAAVVSLLAKEKGGFVPDMQILYYPSCYNDYSETSPFESVRLYGEDYILTRKRIKEYMDLYVKNEEDINSPLVAPLLAEDVTGQPDTLIITAEFDPLRDEGEAYGRKLAVAGNVAEVKRMKNAVHGFLSLPKNSETMITCYEYVEEFFNN